MKQRIKSPRTELVTVPSELLDEPETENRRFGGVMKNVETDQARVQVLISSVIRPALNKFLHFVIEFRYKTIHVCCQDDLKFQRITRSQNNRP